MFQVDLYQLKKVYMEQRSQYDLLSRKIEEIEDIFQYFCSHTQGMEQELQKIRKTLEDLLEEKEALFSVLKCLEQVCEIYELSEQRIIDLANEELLLQERPEFQWINTHALKNRMYQLLYSE